MSAYTYRCEILGRPASVTVYLDGHNAGNVNEARLLVANTETLYRGLFASAFGETVPAGAYEADWTGERLERVEMFGDDFACCTSSIGPRCGHALGGVGVTLETAARESIALPLVDGEREGDPLVSLVNASTWADMIDHAELVTGRAIERGRGDEMMAARVRAALRRYAVKVAGR